MSFHSRSRTTLAHTSHGASQLEMHADQMPLSREEQVAALSALLDLNETASCTPKDAKCGEVFTIHDGDSVVLTSSDEAEISVENSIDPGESAAGSLSLHSRSF